MTEKMRPGLLGGAIMARHFTIKGFRQALERLRQSGQFGNLLQTPKKSENS